MRTGIGYDIHKLIEGRKLILGGEEIDYEKGLEGHSDADVIIHAVADAILGSASLGDIGKYFPDTEAAFKGVSSIKLLAKIREMIAKKNYEVNNVDVTVICEKPNLSGYMKKMCKNIADTLKIPQYDVNIKATTNEKLGEIGKGNAIAAFSVVTIIPSAAGYSA